MSVLLSPSMPMNFFIALAAAALVAIAGVFSEWLARQRRLRGYGEIAADIRSMATALHGEVDRDGNDLLLRVNVQDWPVLVRFSNSANEPGLNIRTPVAGKLAFYCVPRSTTHSPHPESLPTGDSQFDSRFRVTASEPFLGKLLLGIDPVVGLLQRICCSSTTSLSMEDRYLEVSESLIPEDNLALHVSDHIADLARLAHITRNVVGVDASHIKPFRRAPNWFRVVYSSIAVGLVGVGLWLGRPAGPVKVVETPSTAPKHTIPSADAARIPNLKNWRLLEAGDFSAIATAYLQQQGRRPEGQIEASFSGASADSAYLLINTASNPQPVRLILIINQQVRFDANMPRIDVAARIPKSRLSGIEWRGHTPVGEPDGDGLLIVRDYGDPSSAIVLYWSGVQVLSGNPKDFHLIALQ
jgi:hypothetical protein